MRFSPNGRYILAWTLDSCIRLWDYVSGTCKKTYQGHVNKTISLGGAFGVSHSEAFIVSGSEDGDIVFWDVKTKEVVQRISGAHEGTVCWVDALSGPVNKVASAGIDGSVRIWFDTFGESDTRLSNGSKVHGHKHEDDMMDVEDENQDDYHTPQDDMREIDGHFDQRMEEMTI